MSVCYGLTLSNIQATEAFMCNGSLHNHTHTHTPLHWLVTEILVLLPQSWFKQITVMKVIERMT